MKLIIYIKTQLLKLISFILSITDWLSDLYNKKLLEEQSEKDHSENLHLSKSEYVFQEYLKDPNVTSTDDIAAFFTTGVGKELVEKTNEPVKKTKEYNRLSNRKTF